MAFFFRDHRLTERKSITARAALACFFLNSAEAQIDLSMATDRRPNTVVIPSEDCSPNGPVWTEFANFWLFFNRQALGYLGLVFRYHTRRKLEENLATLVKKYCTKKKISVELSSDHLSKNWRL